MHVLEELEHWRFPTIGRALLEMEGRELKTQSICEGDDLARHVGAKSESVGRARKD